MAKRKKDVFDEYNSAMEKKRASMSPKSSYAKRKKDVFDEFNEEQEIKRAQMSPYSSFLPEDQRSVCERTNAPLDVLSQVERTQTKTLMPIYRGATMANNYLSQYDDNTGYSDVSNDISRLRNIRGGEARRGRSTAAYDRALDMLKGYAGSRYRLDDTGLSYDDREAIYNDNKKKCRCTKKRAKTAAFPQTNTKTQRRQIMHMIA